MRFREFLTEAFDKPYDYQWTKKSDKAWFGQFKSNGATIEFRATQSHVNKHSLYIVFDRNGMSDKTNTGDQFKIFATILKMLSDVVSALAPEEIEFTSDKPFEPGQGINVSRAKLYKKMCDRFAKAHGYDAETKEQKYNVDFTLTKRN